MCRWMQKLTMHSQERKDAEEASDKVRAFLQDHCVQCGGSPLMPVSVSVLLDHYRRMTGDVSMPEWRFVGALWQLSLWKLPDMAVQADSISGVQLQERTSSAVRRQKVREFLEQCCDTAPAISSACMRLGELHEAFVRHSDGEEDIRDLPQFLRALWQLELEMPSLRLHSHLSRIIAGGWEQLPDMLLCGVAIKPDRQEGCGPQECLAVAAEK